VHELPWLARRRRRCADVRGNASGRLRRRGCQLRRAARHPYGPRPARGSSPATTWRARRVTMHPVVAVALDGQRSGGANVGSRRSGARWPRRVQRLHQPSARAHTNDDGDAPCQRATTSAAAIRPQRRPTLSAASDTSRPFTMDNSLFVTRTTQTPSTRAPQSGAIHYDTDCPCLSQGGAPPGVVLSLCDDAGSTDDQTQFSSSSVASLSRSPSNV